ncbi:MAG: geranylgeranylglyceryl/heptaprenylglyceryl phosphate synthase [Candidatus Bathyarchaeota archaeon]|nr:geranylgeranylglyceryl/heptaprenylglyceryl phosphate synthase [Candidatus Bathyarchaeota archaeon]MDH5732678.1 geranylgeranylglyceryl/heptaprenylglyceryl phosphate synthase [Candidatus Bathyarchaeota archaeon]
MVNNVEKYLKDKILEEGSIHITLIDPEKVTPQSASAVAHDAESCGTTAIMIGGSTFVLTNHLDRVIKAIKRTVKIPIILFPNNVSGISRYADAIWFMSLLNSSDPYFIFGAQVLGAPLIRKFGLEAIPLGYIVVGEGGAVGVVGRVCPIPYNKPELAAAHALAAQYLGMRFVYLEAGSGAKQPVPNNMIKMVKDFLSVPLIVGGGINTKKQVKQLVEAGAGIIVTGTVTERASAKPKLRELIGQITSR